MRRIALLLFVLVPFKSSFAQEYGCHNGPVHVGERNPFYLMRVIDHLPRIHFIEEKSEKKLICPSLSEACKRKAFLLPGDEVIAGSVEGELVCVTYIAPNAKRVKGRFTETSGFLPKSSLEPAGSSTSNPEIYAGSWLRSDGEATIGIHLSPAGKLQVKGEATFGAFDPDRVQRGAVSSGELVGEGALRGNALAVGEGYTNPAKRPSTEGYECQARLRLYGRYLAVEDNMQCGGINVSFTGFYIRER